MHIAGHGYRLSQYDCQAGPGDLPFEERHAAPTLAVVRGGRFSYHGKHGKALLQGGSIMLGNPGCHYCCSHEDSHGDQCSVIHFDSELFAEASRDDAGFGYSALPPLAGLVPAIARFDRGLPDAPLLLLEAVLTTCGTLRAAPGKPNLREQRALRRSVDLIESAYADPLSLDDLARCAAMSRFHYLRCFRRVYATTPYRYLQARRLARAAQQLACSQEKIADIAFACGFGDLSTFNAGFKAAFGQSPGAWRDAA
ncbi:MAG: helix-turn-helix transcriptional regulator [Erythrobacter sp.]|nr:helix-turn-helix transcriptional regulator [Erythrobacter sp.]